MEIHNQNTFINLCNKVIAWEKIKYAISDAQQREMALAVIYINLDCGGETAKESIVMEAARRLNDKLKDGDIIVQADRCEFIVCAVAPNDFIHIESAVQDIINILKLPYKVWDLEITISVNVGCTIYPVDGCNMEELIVNAAAAAYMPSQKNDSGVVYGCDTYSNDYIAKELKLTKNLYEAVGKNELELYYQPVVDIKTGNIICLEALLRWKGPDNETVGPEKMISIAEKTDFIYKLDEWVIRTACRQNKTWQDKRLGKYIVAVNISARHFEDYRLVNIIKNVLYETQLSAEYLELEVTESTVIKNMNNIKDNLNKLRRLGVILAIDDFGTSYSSLKYIKQLPIDIVKIDRCFIEDIGIYEKGEDVLKAMISLINKLKLHAVAEGVETKRQVDFLASEGCFSVQGYYYYEPMPVDKIEKILKPNYNVCL